MRKKVERAMQEYRARGLAVAGPQETLEALANGQVEELLISGGLEQSHPEPEAKSTPSSRPKSRIPRAEPRVWNRVKALLPDLLVTKRQANQRHGFLH